MILRNARRHYSVRALTYVIAYSLSKHSLAEILTRGDFPETKKHIRKAAIKLALRRELVRIAASPLLSRIGATSPKAHAQGQPKAAQQGTPVAIAPFPGPSKGGPPATTAIKPSAETETTTVPPGGAGVVGMTRRITRFNTSATMDPRFLEPMGEDNPHAPKKLFKRSVSEDPDAGQEEHSTAMHLIGEEVLGPEQRALYAGRLPCAVAATLLRVAMPPPPRAACHFQTNSARDQPARAPSRRQLSRLRGQTQPDAEPAHGAQPAADSEPDDRDRRAAAAGLVAERHKTAGGRRRQGSSPCDGKRTGLATVVATKARRKIARTSRK